MLTLFEKIVFLLLALALSTYGGTKLYAVYRAIARGKPDARFDDLPERIRRALWIVLTQQSVFKTRPIDIFLARADFLRLRFLFSRQSGRCARRLFWHSRARRRVESV